MAGLDTQPPPTTRNRWSLVAGTGIGVFMAQLDATIVGVALPAVQADLHASTAVLEWAVLAYVLPLIALTLPSGRWLDRVGQRPALLFCVVGFTAASVLAGLAGGIGWLIAARVGQGLFGAVLFALLPVLTATAVSPAVRGRAMGLVMTLGTLGGISGPLLGGYLIELVGWRAIFFANVPVGLVVIGIGLAQIPAGGRIRRPGLPWLQETGLLAAGTLAVMGALSAAASHGLAWLVLGVAGIPFLLAWRASPVSTEVRALMGAPGMRTPQVATPIGVAAVMLVLFLMPFYLLNTLHLTPSEVGVTMLAFPAPVVLLGALGGVLADRWGAHRVAVAGAVLLCTGLLSLIPLEPAWTSVAVAWRLVIVGAGAGLFGTANQTLVMTKAPRRLLGTAAATTSVGRQLGAAVGPALATLVWAESGYATSGMRVAVAVAAVLGLVAVLVTLWPRRSRTGEVPAAPPP